MEPSVEGDSTRPRVRRLEVLADPGGPVLETDDLDESVYGTSLAVAEARCTDYGEALESPSGGVRVEPDPGEGPTTYVALPAAGESDE